MATVFDPSLTVASSAFTSTEENDPPSTWVMNGKPPMLTSGLVGVDSSDCSWPASTFWATALATRSPTISTANTASTLITAIITVRDRGLRGGWAGGACPATGCTVVPPACASTDVELRARVSGHHLGVASPPGGAKSGPCACGPVGSGSDGVRPWPLIGRCPTARRSRW